MKSETAKHPTIEEITAEAKKVSELQWGKNFIHPPKVPTPIEDTAWNLSIAIANHEDTYKLLMEFAHKILTIAGVKII